MKQAELDKLFNPTLKQVAKANGWKYSRGFVFRATDLLFFSNVITGRVSNRHISYMLRYKLLAFDDLFWKIVNLEENSNQPLSFRAAGVWTAPSLTITEDDVPIVAWDEGNMHTSINEIMSRCQVDAQTISLQIKGLDDNLVVMERLCGRHKQAFPISRIDIWREKMLTLILKKEYEEAEKIIRERMEANDDGGFRVGSKSFYQLAEEYLQKVK